MVKPRPPFDRLTWAHYRQGDECPVPVGLRELVVELVEPRLPNGMTLFITFLYRDVTGEGAWTWAPRRLSFVMGEEYLAYQPLPGGDTFGPYLRDVPVMHLIRAAREYAGEQPRDPSGSRALADALDRVRAIRAEHGPRARLDRFRDEFVQAHGIALAIAPHRATALLAESLGVGTATIRRWIAAITAAEGPQEGGKG